MQVSEPCSVLSAVVEQTAVLVFLALEPLFDTPYRVSEVPITLPLSDVPYTAITFS